MKQVRNTIQIQRGTTYNRRFIVSIFRPSDDANSFSFLIPSNYFAVVSLRQLAEMFKTIIKDTATAKEARELADEVEQALKQYAITEHLDYRQLIPFEANGFGNFLFMDDSNVPSLLALRVKFWNIVSIMGWWFK